MNANDGLERRLADFYESESSPRAPDRVLRSALQTIDDTRQRRVVIRVPWRFPHMHTFAKVAIAAVVVIAVGALGLSVLRAPSSSDVGGQPAASPSPSPFVSSSPSPSNSIAPPPALTQTFTSKRHGFSISYPAGWSTMDSTGPWISGIPSFGEPAADIMYDPILRDHLFILVTSRPLAGEDGARWADETLTALATADDCALPLEPVTTGGGPGLRCGSAVATWAEDRGYVILLYTSGDEPALVAGFDQAYFDDVLATLRLVPGDAVDTAPSASP